ncbi:MAG TPA: MCP four helix bundle domain-containing protein, partial [Candidatus Methylacidiphilales bacterium]
MKDWTIRTRVLFGFTLLIALAAFIGLFSIGRISDLRVDVDAIAATWVPSVKTFTDIEVSFMKLRRNVVLGGWLLASGSPAEAQETMADVTKAAHRLTGLIDDYKDSVAYPLGEGKFYEAVTAANQAFGANLATYSALIAAGKAAETLDFNRKVLFPSATALEEALEAETEFNRSNLDDQSKQSSVLASTAVAAIWIGLGT